MSTHATPTTLAAAAALCALLATLAATSGVVPRRRSRRLLEEPTRDPGRTGSLLARLASAVTGVLRGTSADEPAEPVPARSQQGRERDASAGDVPKAAVAPPADQQALRRTPTWARPEGPRAARGGTTGAHRPRAGTARRTRTEPEPPAPRPDALPGAGEVVPPKAPFGASPSGRRAADLAVATPGADARQADGRVRGPGGSAGRLRDRAMRRPELLCVPAAVTAGLMTASLVPVVAGLAAVAPVGRALRRRAERAAAERGAAAVSALCGTLAGDLRAGRPPHVALAEAVEDAGWARRPELSAAAGLLCSAARFGGDVPQALRAASRLNEGTRGLAAVAACWQVAVDGGAGLAAALDRVAAALRAEADQREDLRAQLAGPRSTAVLLALLPVFGVVLGAGLGADPSRVLLHTLPGLLCLCLGVALEWAGLAWTARIIHTAEGGRPKGTGMGWFRGRQAP